MEGMEELVTYVADPSTGGGIHVDVWHVFLSGHTSNPPLWIGNVVGDPLQQLDTGGLTKQVIYLVDRQKNSETARW